MIASLEQLNAVCRLRDCFNGFDQAINLVRIVEDVRGNAQYVSLLAASHMISSGKKIDVPDPYAILIGELFGDRRNELFVIPLWWTT